MGHEVKAVVAPAPALHDFASRHGLEWPCPLAAGWALLPMSDEVIDHLFPQGTGSPAPEGFVQLGPRFLAMLRESFPGGAVYFETGYFGGSGGQCAVAVRDGRIVSAPACSRSGAINSAMQALGFAPAPGQDAFDTLGLGRHRLTSDWADAAAQTRTEATVIAAGPTPAPPPPQPGPMVRLGCIAAGVFAGVLAALWAAGPGVNPFLLASMGGSAVFLFGLTRAPAAQPRALFGGHLVGAFIGIACYQAFGDALWVYALAQTLALLTMLLARCVHPPAGANPILMVHVHASWSALWQPVFVGVAVLAAVAVVWTRLVPGHAHYPVKWADPSPPTPFWGGWGD